MNTDKKSVQQMPSSIVDAQLQRLMEVVNEYQRQQCEDLIAKARLQSENIIRHTYRSGRSRLQQHIQEDRRELQQSLAAARARQHTFTMQQKHKASREFLDESWVLLKESLLRRWNIPENRQTWIQSCVSVARRSLPADEWLIAHGKNWTNQDKENLLQLIAAPTRKTVTFKTDDSIDAGIKIQSNGAQVDSTLKGLMEDRVRIESEILAQCTHCMVEVRKNMESAS